ncbi:hypothetical protein FMM05_03495 [Flavobacterium zepuense]|uniref:Uncharacterized protein n=1 Tax=Flavobacterium zepuense TaxID=2593302 RepID=A0A552V7L1_9FLAO|nr:hypothetical protein [Flavobacterium zepuense]TRW26457.1 hypothetical protein FMM05_03495 [Flavobacterium zepuense]
MTEYQIDAWKKEIYNSLAAIADLEGQKLQWVGSTLSGNKILNRLFDLEFETFISYLIENEEGSRELLSNMIRMERVLHEYVKANLSDDKLLADPNWHLITQKATEILMLWDRDMEE